MMPGFGRIKAITFDGDMTLWDFERVMRISLGVTLDHLRRCRPGPTTDGLTVERMVEIRERVAAEFHHEPLDLEQIRLQAFVRTLALVGIPDPDLAAELNALYMKHRFEDLELYPDVIPALDGLTADYALGFLSNGNSAPARCGLGGRFAFEIMAQDVGMSKPDPRVFLLAAERARCRPDELVHVGDSLTSDVAGAHAAGLISVWLNRSAMVPDAGVRPDFEIRSLGELRGALAGADPSLNREIGR